MTRHRLLTRLKWLDRMISNNLYRHGSALTQSHS